MTKTVPGKVPGKVPENGPEKVPETVPEDTSAPLSWFAPLERYQGIFLAFFLGAYVLLATLDLVVRGISPFANLWWPVSFGVALMVPSFLRARRVALGLMIQGLAEGKDTFQGIYDNYIQKKEQGWEPTIIGALTGGFFFLVTYFSSDELFRAHGSLVFWVKSVAFGCGFGFFARAFWLTLCFGWLVNHLSKELEANFSHSFSFELLERAGKGCGRIALGTGAISACLLWMFLGNFWFFQASSVFLPYQIFIAECLFWFTTFFPFYHLIMPQIRFHRMLVTRKDEIRRLFFSELLQTEKAFIANPSKDLAQKYLLERQIIQGIENLPEWPLRTENLFPFLSVVTVPIALFLVKEIVVDVLVELLKK